MAMMFRGLGKPTDQLDIQLAQASNPFGAGGFVEEQRPPVDAQPRKFGTWDAIGILGDALSSFGGGQASYLPGLAAQARQQNIARQKLQAEQAKRTADWEDWVRQKQWERDNPAPTQGSEFERLLDAANLTPEQRLATVRSRVENTANPLQAVTVYNPDGSQGLQFIRPNQMVGGSKGGDGYLAGPGTASQTPGSFPAIGSVEDGYRYIGGDPSKKESWQSVGGQTATPSASFP